MKRAAVVALVAAVLFGTAVPRLAAQGSAADSSTVDRIMAVVGTKAILASQVQEEIYGRVRNGQERLPDQSKDPEAFTKAMTAMMRRYVDTLIAFELLHTEALTDTTIKVTDQEVGDAADQIIANARKQFKTDAEFKDQLHQIGFTTTEDWRRWLLDNQRRMLVVHRYEAALKEDNKIKDMTPTAKEIRAFYDAHHDDFGLQPATVSFKQIIVAPKPTEAAKAKARALADSLAVELRKGSDTLFASFARRFSMDEGSKAEGGSLPWFTRGKMVREFEDVAFNLKPGTISDPIERPYGYHVIQVLRVQPGEVQARHILIIPEVDSAGSRAAHDRASDVVAALGRGASFDSLQHLYHDRAEDLELNSFPADSLASTPYGAAIAGVDSGKVTQPFMLPVPSAPLHSKWAVVMITRRAAAGPPPFEDVKPLIKRLLGTMLGEQAYINQLRVRTYVDIRDP